MTEDYVMDGKIPKLRPLEQNRMQTPTSRSLSETSHNTDGGGLSKGIALGAYRQQTLSNFSNRSGEASKVKWYLALKPASSEVYRGHLCASLSSPENNYHLLWVW